MDKNFLDYWARFFTTAARNQKQLDQMTEWTRTASNSFAQWTASVQRLFGPEVLTPPGPKTTRTQAATALDYPKWFIEAWFGFWGLESAPEPRVDVMSQCRELKERIASQEETIKHLRLLLEEARRENLALAALRGRGAQGDTDNSWNATSSSSQT